MMDLDKLATTMKQFSSTAGDHHWQAGIAISLLSSYREIIKTQFTKRGLKYEEFYSMEEALEILLENK